MSGAVPNNYLKKGWNHWHYATPPKNQLIEVVDQQTKKIEVVVWRSLGGVSFDCLVSAGDFLNRNRVRFQFWRQIKTKPIPINQKLQTIKESQGFE